MTRPNYIPIRLSDNELSLVKVLGLKAGVSNTSESIRYTIAFTALELAGRDDLPLKPGETVAILPEKLIQKIEGLRRMENIDNLEDRIKVLIEFWEKL